MGEAVMSPLHAAVGSVKDLDKDANLDPSTTLFHRRIDFHLARKPFTGFSDGGNSGFKLETLNPNNSNSGSKSEPHRAWSGSGSGTAKASEENNSGLDPELSFRITFRRIGAGLQNLGNTCFLNSVLQCLTYTEPLAAYLQSGRHKTSCRTAGFCALCAIQKHVSRALESTGRILAPKDLVSNLRCISRNFRNARQEDAHEYMVNLLESMHKCCLPSGVPSESPSAYEKSLVHKIFGGRLRSQVKCMQCSFCSNKFDPFLDLSLEIVKADSLYKALAHFTAKEQLDGGERQYQCQQCKQKVKALKQLTVYKAPQVLTIHLKRFGSHTGQKIDRRVEFGPTLDLKPFVTGPYDGDLKYTLYGVLVHAGWSTHSGHYYCFVRTSSGMWYTLDDNQVYQVSERKVLEQKAYMLFYVRDRRSTVTKKTVDIVQKESMVINALESKGYNNLSHGLKETIQNGSPGEKLNDSVAAVVAKKDLPKAHFSHKSQMQIDCGKQVNGLVASECSSLKKDNPPEASLKVLRKVDSVNGFPTSNLRGANGLLHSASSFKGSNGSLSLGNSLGTDGSSQSAPTAPIAVQHERNDYQNSAAKDESDSVVIQTTCSGNLSSGKDLNNTIDQPPKSNLLHRSSGETTVLAKNKTGEVGGLSGTANMADSTGQNVHDIGEESVPKEMGLVCKEAPDGKLHVAKRRPFKRQVTRMQLSSKIIFSAAVGQKKKKHRRRRGRSGKQDGNSVLSDLGPSTSENSKTLSKDCSGRSPIRVKSCSDEEKKCLNNITGNGHIVVDQELRSRIGQDDTVLSNDKQSKSTTSITKLPSSRESRCSNYIKKDHVENGLMSMLTRGLEETTVARWDGLELPSSKFVDSRSTESVSIGYVADEWDEEYDRGKRKKIRNKELTFGGPNPFQEIALKKAKEKKQKLDHSSSANQPFRI